ncbi:hypothetical protein C8R46DRAFT_1048136 [Mycena filopes]|nr:hypothetical protein C8R46DRAFT_1048136 [Mycena filopes]
MDFASTSSSHSRWGSSGSISEYSNSSSGSSTHRSKNNLRLPSTSLDNSFYGHDMPSFATDPESLRDHFPSSNHTEMSSYYHNNPELDHWPVITTTNSAAPTATAQPKVWKPALKSTTVKGQAAVAYKKDNPTASKDEFDIHYARLSESAKGQFKLIADSFKAEKDVTEARRAAAKAAKTQLTNLPFSGGAGLVETRGAAWAGGGQRCLDLPESNGLDLRAQECEAILESVTEAGARRVLWVRSLPSSIRRAPESNGFDLHANRRQNQELKAGAHRVLWETSATPPSPLSVSTMGISRVGLS